MIDIAGLHLPIATCDPNRGLFCVSFCRKYGDRKIWGEIWGQYIVFTRNLDTDPALEGNQRAVPLALGQEPHSAAALVGDLAARRAAQVDHALDAVAEVGALALQLARVAFLVRRYSSREGTDW